MDSESLVSLRRQHSRDAVYDSSSSKTVHGFADSSDEDHRLAHRASYIAVTLLIEGRWHHEAMFMESI